MDGQWRNARPRDVMVASLERDAAIGPQPPHQLDLFLGPLAPVAEILAKGFVFDCVPTYSDAEAKLPLGEQVDLGRLLGDQHGLPLRDDDDAGDERRAWVPPRRGTPAAALVDEARPLMLDVHVTARRGRWPETRLCR